LEEWVNEKGDGGVQIAGLIFIALQYVDDVTLARRTLHNIHKPLTTLETFLLEVVMDVNIGKTKVVIFSLKNMVFLPTIKFSNEPLEIIRAINT
jgi:hypothetical protein